MRGARGFRDSGVSLVLRSLKFIFAYSLIAFTLVACGKSQTAVRSNGDGIIGGKDADGTEIFFPHIASLGDKFGPFCTISLISESIAITAAHCLTEDPANLIVYFGTEPAAMEPEQLQVRKVQGYVVSPFWAHRQEEDVNNGDIGVIRFSGGLPKGFKPISLLKDVSHLSVGQDVILAGYGANDGKAGTGGGKLRYTTTTILKPDFTLTELAFDQSKGTGACYGDSGGPAYAEMDGELVVVGVTSRGTEDDCSGFVIYTSVPFYLSWIERSATALDKKFAAPKLAQAQ